MYWYVGNSVPFLKCTLTQYSLSLPIVTAVVLVHHGSSAQHLATLRNCGYTTLGATDTHMISTICQKPLPGCVLTWETPICIQAVPSPGTCALVSGQHCYLKVKHRTFTSGPATNVSNLVSDFTQHWQGADKLKWHWYATLVTELILKPVSEIC